MHVGPRIFSNTLLAVLVACSAARPAQDVAAVRVTVDSLLAIHARHFREGNVDSLVGAYTDSVVVRPQNIETVRGHDALRATLAGWITAAPIKTIAYTTDELAVHGDTAFHIASYRATLQPPGSAEMTDNGRCTLLWLRDPRNGWKIHRSMCNSGAPVRQVAPGAR
jgi:ketosteroid isomerase-like protein